MLLNMLKTKRNINQQNFKIVDLHLTWIVDHVSEKQLQIVKNSN